MRGPQFMEEIHRDFVAEKFQLYDEGDKENRWNVTEVPLKGAPIVHGGNNKMYEWWENICAGDGNIESEIIGMKKDMFLNNVKSCVEKYLVGPNRKR